ncbi:hypothetical protein [Gemmatimonas sp.]|jgi:steroid 5-alpha reductase family enzyme|nr:hypothetical protein [Gemmatimonas sp.]
MIQRVRIALIAVGVAAFTIAQQTGREWLRWVGVVLVAVAFLLRFARR